MADATRVVVPRMPAWVWLMPKTAINVPMRKLNICTSSASSPHPPKQPQNVLFSPWESSVYQLNMLFPQIVLCRYSRQHVATATIVVLRYKSDHSIVIVLDISREGGTMAEPHVIG